MQPKALQPSTPSPAPIHIDGVDGLRGCAALMIVVYHMYDACGAPILRIHGVNVLRPLQDGWCGVNLFLVLSGFCLFWPYARDSQRKLDYVQFMRRRVRRIIPAYYASLLFVPMLYYFVWSALHVPNRSAWPTSMTDVLLHLTLLHTLDWHTFYSWNGVSWSLGLEWLWYLLFPLAVWSFRRRGPIASLCIMALITISYAAGTRIIAGPLASLPFEKNATLLNFVANRLFEFGLGMFAAHWLAHRKISRTMVRMLLLLTPFTLVAAHFQPPLDAIFPMRYALYGISFTLILLVTVAPEQNSLRRLCRGKLLRFVGEGSYSLYLLHLPFVTLISKTLLGHVASASTAFFLSLSFVPLIVLITRLNFLAFERPFLKPAPAKSATRPMQITLVPAQLQTCAAAEGQPRV